MFMGFEICGVVSWIEGIFLRVRVEVGCFVGMWDRIGLKKWILLLKAGIMVGGLRKGLNVTI